MNKYLSVPVCLILMLTGCARMSLQELRSEPPARTETFSVDYAALGTCTASALQWGPVGGFLIDTGSLTYETFNLSSERRFTVTGKSGDLSVIDLVFQETASFKTGVESRWGAAFRGSSHDGRRAGMMIDEKTWPVILQCAQRLKSAG